MTTAVCCKCGEFKVGAWTDCSKCKFRPKSEQELVVSMLLSDNYLDTDALSRLAVHVARGLPVQFESSTRNSIVRMIRSMPAKAVSVATAAGIEPAVVGIGIELPWTFVDRPACGGLEATDDGNFTIVAMSGLSTGHCLGHVLIRTIADPNYSPKGRSASNFNAASLRGHIAKWAAIRNGVWPDEMEEKFVRQFEAFHGRRQPALRPSWPSGAIDRDLEAVFEALEPGGSWPPVRIRPWWKFW